MRYKLIYTCGDSHTAGGETADDLIWPAQHPGFYTRDELAWRDTRELMRWRDFRDRSLRRGDPVDWTGWQEREHEQAWPARLGKLLGCEIINNARIGSSMEWIARQTMIDVTDLLTKHAASELLVVVQPSTYLRMQMHDPSQGGWTSFQMADAYGMDEHVHRWFNEMESDTSLATRWLIALMGMIGYLQSRGVRVILTDSAHNPIAKALRDQHDLGNLIAAYGDMTSALWHLETMEDAALSIEKCYCPDLHWTRDVHQRFAESLATAIQG